MRMSTGYSAWGVAFIATIAVAMVLIAVGGPPAHIRPPLVVEHGGTEFAWTDSLEREWTVLMQCVGKTAKPDLSLRLWRLPDSARTFPEVGQYHPPTHSVVVHPAAEDGELAVLRHEFLHAVDRTGDHGPLFALAAQCGFLP